MYIYDYKEWPSFSWNKELILEVLLQVRHLQGRLLGGMESIGFQFKNESLLQNLTEEVVKSSEIEGEIFDPTQVRSSVARHLGLELGAIHPVDRNIDGIVKMTLDATQHFEAPLTKERLWHWHATLFPDGISEFSKIKRGGWRNGDVSVVSGFMGKEKLHFEGPKAIRIDLEMARFCEWVNTENGIDLLIKAGISHLWFVTIHPFEDGNGRIGRAIVDLFLARSEESSNRFYALSAQIQKERKAYYAILEKTQKGALDITSWLLWFLECLGRAIKEALGTLEKIIHKNVYLEKISKITINERQRKMIDLILTGFEGKVTTSKWAKITKCSQDTAHRDIVDLIEKKILVKNPEGGRNTSYSLVL